MPSIPHATLAPDFLPSSLLCSEGWRAQPSTTLEFAVSCDPDCEPWQHKRFDRVRTQEPGKGPRGGTVQYVLALDQGTTSSLALLFDQEGTIRSVAQQEFSQIFPQPGWVEHDPEQIVSSQVAVALEALAKVRARPQEVAAIGIANQRETTIVWSRETGEPVC